MASIDFTELFATITTSTVDAWTEVDLTSLGVPANAVVCVLMQNVTDGTTGYEGSLGIRKVGSGLSTRYVIQHEAEGDGSTSVVMHAQADADSSIEYLKGHTDSIFTLLGYYGTGITYTEEITEHASVTVQTWESTAVGQNDTVFEFCCQNDGGDGNTATNVGTREVGSSLARYYDIHEAEPSGINCYTSYAQSDSSGNVELYRGDAYGQFYRLGYFSSNVQLYATFDNFTPASDATWGKQNPSITTYHTGCVALVACMHHSAGSEELTGARGGDSSAARYWTEHESETDQYTGDTLPCLVGAGAEGVDTYFGDVSDGRFYCLGYLYDTGGAPAAVAPTSVLYGPLCGPLAGPI